MSAGSPGLKPEGTSRMISKLKHIYRVPVWVRYGDDESGCGALSVGDAVVSHYSLAKRSY
jgi:hypothetical protein